MQPLALLAVLSTLTATGDVRALAADGEALWLGTTGGLVRLEGDRARVLTPRDGLPDGTVRALAVSGRSLWVGTDRGAAEVDLDSGRVARVLRTSGSVRAIERFRGDLWLGTWDGLVRVPPGEGAAEALPAIRRVTALRAAGDRLYVTTAGDRAHVFDGRAWRRLRCDRLAWDLAVDGEEAWVATSRGVRLFVRGRPVSRPAVRASRDLPVSDVRALRLVGGRLVAATWGGGLVAWTGSSWEPLPGQPAALARASALGLDPAGRLLAGTPAGLATLDRGTWSLRPGAGLPDNDLSCLALTSEGLWIGTFRAGLALLRPDGSVEVWSEDRGLVDDRVNRLAVDREGDLWVATDRGLMERREGRFRLRGLLGQHVFVVGTAGAGLYASAGGGLLRWDGRGLVVHEQPGRRVQDLAGGPGPGEVAVATAEGLALAPAAGPWRLLAEGPAGLPDDWATAVAVWDGGLAVGTYNAGLVVVRGERVETLAEDLWVNAGALASSGGLLAAGTLDRGLWLHDGRASRTLTTAEGLPDDDVTDVLPDGRGGLWVATRGGLARVAAAE